MCQRHKHTGNVFLRLHGRKIEIYNSCHDLQTLLEI